MDAAGMYAPLSGDEVASASHKAARAGASKVPIVPVPADAPEMKFKHPKLGVPSMSWPYRDADGQLVGYVCRWDFEGADGKRAKEILPVTYCDLGNGKRGWRSKGIPAPRPLYGLPAMLANPDAIVLLVEGEKTRDAARDLFPDHVAITPAHGAKSPQLADFGPLAGRTVIVWPDFDEPGRVDDRGRPLHPGRDFADKVTALATAAGAAEVRRIAPDILAAWRWVDEERVPRGEPIPDGWDLADAIEEGWTPERANAFLLELAGKINIPDAAAVAKASALFNEMVQGANLDEAVRLGAEAWTRLGADPADEAPGEADAADEEDRGPPFRLVWNGVEKRVERVDRETGITTVEWKWFCSVLEVGAETRSADGEEWGRLLLITDRDGRTKPWAMPMAMLAGDGTAYRERLLSLGVTIAPSKFAKDALHEYISTARTNEKARCVGRVGWHLRAFTLSNQTVEHSHG